jgi:hypothetical protein
VREVGRVTSLDGDELAVGTSYDTVTLGYPELEPLWRLTSSQAEEFAQLFVSACWEAAAQGGAP